ncbi:hypothetical protein [Paraburkholderia sp. JHI869]|uniref:hypothetical protein n=1 Tax=Paraburkholderia sp. JHI869 TaxID=3112959 RepID=UPI00317D7D55
MWQRSEDLLVALLRLDAQIRARVDHLAEMEREAEEYLVPRLEAARAVLQTDLAKLRVRREEKWMLLMNWTLERRRVGSREPRVLTRISRTVIRAVSRIRSA